MTPRACRYGNRNKKGSLKGVAATSLAVVAVLVLLLWAPWRHRGVAGDQQLILYCAAGMLRPVQDIANDYQQEYGVKIQIEPGGSGKLLAKMRAAPNRGDLYLAADHSYIAKARRAGLVAESIPVARIRPVVVVHAQTQQKLLSEGRPITSLDDLLRDDISVALANPELASVGRLTKRLLTESGHWARLEARMKQHTAHKVSTVGTVTEAAQTISLRPGFAGVIWDAVATQHDGLTVVHTAELDGAIEHVTIGILTNAKGDRATAALQFARYLTARDKGLVRFQQHDFDPVPDADEWSENPEIIVMSGAMLKPGIDDAVKGFAKREGVTINTIYNGCGLLVTQMKGMHNHEMSDRFPDAYFSCDVKFMDMVQTHFHASTLISQNELVMIVRKGNPDEIQSLEDLVRDDIKIGLAHPKNSALGKLTDDLLTQLELYEHVYVETWRDRIIHSDAGHDLVNKVRAGALDVAVVYRSNAMATPSNLTGHLDIVELDVAGALAEQPFAIAKNSKHRYLMERLLQEMVAEQTAERFRSLGFDWIYGSTQ